MVGPCRPRSETEGVGFEPTVNLRPQRFSRPSRAPHKVRPFNWLRLAPEPVAPHLPQDNRPTDPDLAAVIDHWAALPEAVRAGIAAMVKAAVPSPESGGRGTRKTRKGGGR